MPPRAVRLAVFVLVASCASKRPEVSSRPAVAVHTAVDAFVDASTDAPSASDASVASAPPPNTRGAFGSAHPTIAVAVDLSERWAVLCQARADTDGDGEIALHAGYHGDTWGDDVSPYLIVGGGEGVAIDDFVRASSDGRWLTYLRGGALLLRDMERNVETDLSALGADATDDDNPLSAPRAATFASDSTRMAYLRRRNGRTFVVVRSLPGGEERELDPGAGEVWRAHLLDGGWIRVDVVARDTDGNGRIDLPRPRTSLASRRCRGAPHVYGVYGWEGDRPVTRLFANGRGAPIEVAEPVVVWSDSVIAREGRALVRVRPNGTRAELTPASCAARVLATYPERRRALIVCAPTGAHQATPEVLSDEGRRPTPFRIEAPRSDGEAEGRYVRLFVHDHADGRDALYDMEALREVETDGELVGRVDARALVRRGEAYVVRDLERGTDTPLAITVARDVWPRWYGSILELGGNLVDLAHARVIGRVEHDPIEVNDAGHALMPTRESEEGFSIGPLRWQTLSALATP